jgi:opacity protein-like surface antigen
MSPVSNLTTRPAKAGGRKRAVWEAGVALAVGLLGASSAWAQCTDNFNFVAVNVPAPGGVSPVSTLLPFGTGSSLGALTSTINSVNTAFLTTTSAFVSAPGNPQPDQQGGGAWARTVAGQVETKSDTTGALTVPGLAVTGSQNCHTTTQQDYYGYQFGHDISVLNAGGTGANVHFGVTAGYFEARNRDVTPGGSFTNPNFPPGSITFPPPFPPFNGTLTTPPGSFADTSQVPFVGIYSAVTKGNFFADGQVRWDFYQGILSDSNNNISNQPIDARGFSVTGNVGYHIPLQNNWFIEPSGGIIWSHVNVDSVNVPGLIQQAPPFGSFAAGTVSISDIDSVLGRASISVGTSFTHGPITWQPYFTASVFHEFDGDVNANSLVVGGTACPGCSLSTTLKGGVGTYGQFALGSAAVLGNSGWLGYARADYRIGDQIEGWSVGAGLRYQFSPERRGSVKDGPAPVVYAYNWSGPYIGASAGATWGGEHWFTPLLGTVDKPDFGGYLLGGQAGYNIQAGRWVYGVELDYGSSNATGGKGCSDPLNFFFSCDAEVHSLAMVTGRLGTTWGRALFYAKGGVAFGDVHAQTSQNEGFPVPSSFGPVNGETKWATGWTVGGGMEFALTDRWSAKAEYMHYDLSKESFAIDFPNIADASTHGDLVRIGVNLHLHPVQQELPLK